MTKESKNILNDALALPPKERAELVEKLLSSFEFPENKSIDKLWAKEAEDRIDAYNQGKIKAVSAKDVFNNINKK